MDYFPEIAVQQPSLGVRHFIFFGVDITFREQAFHPFFREMNYCPGTGFFKSGVPEGARLVDRLREYSCGSATTF